MAGFSKDVSSGLRASATRQKHGRFGSFPVFLADIKVAHTIFALPFAASAVVLIPEVTLNLILAVQLILCMVAARTFAMGINRILDRDIDAQIPRTRSRKIPSGRLSVRDALIWTTFAGGIFISAAFSINRWAGWCSIPVLAIFSAYPLWKRWSWGAHGFLGICLGLSPMAVSVALLGRIEFATVVLGAAVALWTAGFDIIYALLDREHDMELGLNSIPVRFGIRRSLWISRLCFTTCIGLLVCLGIFQDLGLFYYAGVSIIALILMIEHLMVSDSVHELTPKKINAVFFNLNASVSVIFFAFIVLDTWSRSFA